MNNRTITIDVKTLKKLSKNAILIIEKNTGIKKGQLFQYIVDVQDEEDNHNIDISCQDVINDLNGGF